jgi:hypothetical protein
MKLKNFLLIGAVLAAAGIGGATLMCSSDKEEAREETTPVVATETPPPEQEVAQPLLENTAGDGDENTEEEVELSGLREVDKVLMGWIGKDLGSKKRKDAAKGHSWKINLYQDDGQSAMNRAKIDLNRNDKWDEKWTFDGENISRKVAPADDENYSEEYDWNGSDWTAR